MMSRTDASSTVITHNPQKKLFITSGTDEVRKIF